MTISLLNDEQMSNKVGVEHQPVYDIYTSPRPFNCNHDDPENAIGKSFTMISIGANLRFFAPCLAIFPA